MAESPEKRKYLDYDGTSKFWEKVKSALSLKAPLNNPVLTGTPEAPTATAGTNTTQIATTAFVKSAIDNNSSYSTETATLTVAGWSNNLQTVNVSGVTASNTVIVSYAPESKAYWGAADIYCSAQGNGTLTFSCFDTPSSSITANILIMD